MPNTNLYISDADAPLFERFKSMLEKEGKSMAEFVKEAVQKYVDRKTSEPEDIELQGGGLKRVFKGQTLYWREAFDQETGVFLTAKGKIAYWSFHPDAEAETFEVYESLDELLEQQAWLNERRSGAIKREIQSEYVELTKEVLVDHLDI